MKVIVVGCGNIGSAAAEDLSKTTSSLQVVVADNDEKRAKEAAERIGRNNVSPMRLDASNRHQLVQALGDFDLVMGFLPAKLGYGLAEACIDAKKDLVDVSFIAENPLTLNDKALRAGVTIVPDCGLAPGISNVLTGHAVAELDTVKSVHIMVGGLPEKPIPPLGYVITWSPESLIDEYTRKARIVQKGKIVEADVLSRLEEINFPGVGKLEAFLTDGLRNLIDTIGSVEEMWEKTLRYPGHAERVKLLKDLGFFEEKQIDVEGLALSPRKLTAKLLAQKLSRPEIKDIVALKVEVSGIKNDRPTRYVYYLLDGYDEKLKITSMARTTAYPASIIAQLMLKDAITEKGVVPPERIGMNDKLFRVFLDGLKKRKIEIKEERIVDWGVTAYQVQRRSAKTFSA
jgi:saccharopine dehydrogenase-like NADP-dependent oxidoreductase